MSAHKDAFLLALSIPYITQETIRPLIQKASREGTTLSEKLSEKGIVTQENIKAQITAAESEARTVEGKLPALSGPQEEQKQERPQEEQKQESPSKQIKEKPTIEDLPKGLEIMDDPGTTKEDVIKDNLKKADYGQDSEIAKKVLQEIKDRDIKEKEGKEKEGGQDRESEKPLKEKQMNHAQTKREPAKDSKK